MNNDGQETGRCHIVIARRSGERRYLAAVNGEEPLTLRVPLDFLGRSDWTLRAFVDTPESPTEPTSIAESTSPVDATDTVELSLAPAGGYAAKLSARRSGRSR
jgi:alpha-glucosidase